MYIVKRLPCLKKLITEDDISLANAMDIDLAY